MTEIKRNLKVYDDSAINQQNNQLSSAYLGKFIVVVILDIDRYSRTVAQVYLDKLYVNAVMVKTDYAWLYRKYGKDLSLCDLKNEVAYSSSAQRCVEQMIQKKDGKALFSSIRKHNNSIVTTLLDTHPELMKAWAERSVYKPCFCCYVATKSRLPPCSEFANRDLRWRRWQRLLIFTFAAAQPICKRGSES